MGGSIGEERANMSPATSVGTGTRWQVSVKLLLWLLGGGITALIVTFVLASISISGVQSMSAAMVALWIALGIFAFCLLVAGIRATANLDGGKAALVTLLLVGLFVVGLWARSELARWLTERKAIQTAALQIPPPSAPKPPTGQTLPPPRPPVGSKQGKSSSPKPSVMVSGVNNPPIGTVTQGAASAFSNNQQGGITAGTVNIGTPPLPTPTVKVCVTYPEVAIGEPYKAVVTFTTGSELPRPWFGLFFDGPVLRGVAEMKGSYGFDYERAEKLPEPEKVVPA